MMSRWPDYILKINSSNYAPTFEEVDSAYCFRVVRACVRASVRSSRTVHARALKFHIWIPHGKVVDSHVFLVRVVTLFGFMHLWKNQNAIWCMPYLPNLACYGFEISYMDSSWKNSWPVVFFFSEFSPLLELCPLEKFRICSYQQDITKCI